MANKFVIEATDSNFQSDVLNSDTPVVVDFWAPWCGPCRMIGPLLDELAEEFDGQVKVAKVNVDENPTTASNYNIRSIPALLVFKNGELVDQMVGAAPKPRLRAMFSGVV